MNIYVTIRICVIDCSGNFQHFSLFILNLNTSLNEAFYKVFCAAIHHRWFFPSKFNKYIVNTESTHRSQGMFNRMNTYIIFLDCSAPGYINYMINICLYFCTAWYIRPNETKTKIFWSRMKDNRCFNTCMKADALTGL